jgi:hypothetical protein
MGQLNELVSRGRGPVLRAGAAAATLIGRGGGPRQVSTVGRERSGHGEAQEPKQQ